MRIAYADPPYMGQSKKHYGDHADFAGEVDHPKLVEQLLDEYPDGWALSASSRSLGILLPLCPKDVRVGAWVKPFAVIKSNVRVTYAWEPVIWRGGRHDPSKAGAAKDWVSENIVLKNRNGTKGSKPRAFCFWLFDLLNVGADDELVDLFPGSGAVMDAWREWITMTRLPFTHPHNGSERGAKKAQMTVEDAA